MRMVCGESGVCGVCGLGGVCGARCETYHSGVPTLY